MIKPLGTLGDRLVSLLVPDLPVFADHYCCNTRYTVSECRNNVKLVKTCYLDCGCHLSYCVGPNYGGSC